MATPLFTPGSNMYFDGSTPDYDQSTYWELVAKNRDQLDTELVGKAVTAMLGNPTMMRDRGSVGFDADADTLDLPGIYHIPNITVADTVVNFGDKFPSAILNITGTTVVRAQVQFVYGARSAVLWRTMESVGVWGGWGSFAGTSDGLADGLANRVLMDEFTGAMGGTKSTGGLGAVAIRIDHGLNNFNTLVRSLLEARNIPYCIALSSRRWDQAENNAVTPAMVNSWTNAEIWNHGALAHSNATGLPAITDYWVGGKAELEAQLPSKKIYGAILPGTGVSNAFDGLGGASTPQMIYESIGGQVILGSHAIVSGAFEGTDARVLDGTPRQGQWHYTLDSRTPSQVQAKIDDAISRKRGLQLMLHPSLVNQSGNITQAQLVTVLDYIVARRDAGEIVVLSPYEMAVADSRQTFQLDTDGVPYF